jgi:class 3 adenylate cyclase/tetratricopeptide (TPR) repeat protein
VTLCPNCGHENEPGARFCSQCATPLTEAPAAGTERKVVTVVFADLVGFTSRAERLDPEDVQAVLAPYHARLREELERWGGTVEKFIGDAVMALFGAPVAREDDPERAIRAALSIRDWIVEEGELQVRIGVNTGEALVNLAARPESGEGMAAGDVVNTGARLQAAAPTNGILVGETTHRATAQTIEYRDHAAIEAKGKDAPVPVWEVVHARARFGVDLTPQSRTPLVGRDREVEALTAALGRAEQQRSPELVTLVGVPGIGKSRLVGELFTAIEHGRTLTYWRQGRSLPYGEGVSFWALAEMVKAQAGILETDNDEDVASKLSQAVERLIEEDAAWVLGHLRPLVGQAAEVAPGSLEEAFTAWRRFFEALAEQRPLVLVFEDIQWADDGLLDFIEHLADWVKGVPMLILCTARLELLERRPAWGGGKLNAATVALSPLSDEDTARLIAALSDQPLLPAEAQTALLERAGGNPLYAEQYVRMMVERGTAHDLPLPESVQGIIAARLDALPREEKALLQDAAVIGKVFWLGSLEASERQLHSLQQKEFVQRARRSSVEGQTEFAFKHLLVRDVAYAQIPRSERADKHVRVAQWLESSGRPEDNAEMVAHHYSSAVELYRAAGRNLSPITAPAVNALRVAGDRATALGAYVQAEGYFSAAAELAPPDDPERLQLLFRRGRARFLRTGEGEEELEAALSGLLDAADHETAAETALLLAEGAWYQGRREAAIEYLERARSLVEGKPPSPIQVRVLAEVSRYDMLADRNDDAVEVGRTALRMAEELGLSDTVIPLLTNIGCARTAAGDFDGVEDLERSVALAAEANNIRELIRARNNLGAMSLLLGDIPRAHRESVEAYRIALRSGHLVAAHWSTAGPVLAQEYFLGEWDEAVRRADEAIDSGIRSYQSSASHAFRSLMRIARGDTEGAESDAQLAVDLALPAQDPQLVLSTLAMAAVVFQSAGSEARAREFVDMTLAGLRDLVQIGFAITWAHGLAWVAFVQGRPEEVGDALKDEPAPTPWLHAARAVVDGDFRRAADTFGEMGVPTLEAFYRLRSAERLVGEGRRAEADAQLRPALAFYRSVGAARYVREGEALLAASA